MGKLQIHILYFCFKRIFIIIKQYSDDYKQYIFVFSHRCIGTIISTLHILTLASCFTDMGTGRTVSGIRTLLNIGLIGRCEYEIIFTLNFHVQGFYDLDKLVSDKCRSRTNWNRNECPTFFRLNQG